MSGWTPGPWVAAPNRTGSCFIVRSAMQIDRSAGHVCEVDMWSHGDISLPDFAQAQANAHLIAAAPTLYAALELLLRDIEPMERAVGRKTASGDAARAALAMARGKGV